MTVNYALGVVMLALFTALASWRGNPVIFMICAGIAIMLGLYSPDLAVIGRSTLGRSIGLMLILYSFVCIGLAYANLFRQKGEEEE